MLGNMESESKINPGAWEGYTVNPKNGFGLVQWTPSTKLQEWSINWKTGDGQCDRIIYEVENNLQWIPTEKYPMTFKEFTTSDKSSGFLAMVFIANYERPFDSNQPNRGTQAEKWFNFF